jgi:hypothetical protein
MSTAARILASLAVAAILTAAPTSGSVSDDPPVRIRLGDVDWTTEVASAPVMPGRTLRIEVRDPAARQWTLAAPSGQTTRHTSRRWTWRAPDEPGVVEAHLSAAGEGKAQAELKLLVMVPANRLNPSGRLNGYRIGAYPDRPLNGNPLYLPPPGFIEVTRDNEDEHVSPNFRLGQFTSKQSKDFPKYVVLQPELIARLERLAGRLEALDMPSKLHVMSGYRTPYYNRAIGNVQYSLHQWGVAADVFVDEDGDGNMDDLNGDRKIDRADAAKLLEIADALDRRPGDAVPFAGGLGLYGGTRAHGPFVHIDVRGRPARW